MASPEIDAIVERLDAVVADARDRRHRAGYFAAMYRQVTSAWAGRWRPARSTTTSAGAARRLRRLVCAGRYLDVAGPDTGPVDVTAHPELGRLPAAELRDRVILQHGCWA